MLDPLAVALQGVGYPPDLLALQGLVEAPSGRRPGALRRIREAKVGATGARCATYAHAARASTPATYEPLAPFVAPVTGTAHGARRRVYAHVARGAGSAAARAFSAGSSSHSAVLSATGAAACSAEGSLCVALPNDASAQGRARVVARGSVVFGETHDVAAQGGVGLSNQQLVAAAIAARFHRRR